jgi:hypothetical protein
LCSSICSAQSSDSLQRITGYVYDKSNNSLPNSYILNLTKNTGTRSNYLGQFNIGACKTDTLQFSNVACKTLSFPAEKISNGDTIHLEIMYYSLKELKVFEWGSTYEDFKAKMKSMPVTETLGEKLLLPQQKGNPIPNFKNANALSNPLFAITNPVDFLYFNLNKKQQSIRKVIEFNENEKLIRRFDSIYNRTKISDLTGLENAQLDSFLIYLNQNFQCDFNCTEVQITSEIYRKWEYYKQDQLSK